MTVLAKTKTGVERIRRRTAASTAPTPAHADPGRRREAGSCEDEALYSCECGLVFQAPVSTSVDCPHCGSAQAW